MRARFPSDYPLPELRGQCRPDARGVRRAIGRRIEWLQTRILAANAQQTPTSYFLDELAALAVLMDGQTEKSGRFADKPQIVVRDGEVVGVELINRGTGYPDRLGVDPEDDER